MCFLQTDMDTKDIMISDDSDGYDERHRSEGGH